MKRFTVGLVAASLVLTLGLEAKNIAKVDGKVITSEDVSEFLQAIPGASSFDALDKEMQDKIIDQVIEKELLTKNAKKGGIEKEKEYLEALEKIKDNLALEVWMKEEMGKISVDEKDAKKFYNDNKEKFKTPKSIKARHILVSDEKTAKDIIASLKKSKNLEADFIKAAEEKSTGPSGKNGGDLGWFYEKQMIPEFSQVAFAMKKGEMSKAPVKTQYGYHVIYVEDTKEPEQVDFEKVSNNVIQRLKSEKFKEKIQETAKKLRESAKIERY